MRKSFVDTPESLSNQAKRKRDRKHLRILQVTLVAVIAAGLAAYHNRADAATMPVIVNIATMPRVAPMPVRVSAPVNPSIEAHPARPGWSKVPDHIGPPIAVASAASASSAVSPAKEDLKDVLGRAFLGVKLGYVLLAATVVLTTFALIKIRAK